MMKRREEREERRGKVRDGKRMQDGQVENVKKVGEGEKRRKRREHSGI